jgi:hypothetical protein
MASEEAQLLTAAAILTASVMEQAKPGGVQVGSDWDPTQPSILPASVKTWFLCHWEILRSAYSALCQVEGDPKDWPVPPLEATPKTLPPGPTSPLGQTPVAIGQAVLAAVASNSGLAAQIATLSPSSAGLLSGPTSSAAGNAVALGMAILKDVVPGSATATQLIGLIPTIAAFLQATAKAVQQNVPAPSAAPPSATGTTAA